ncbi:response regulator [Klebsiella pneumoniae]|uniref:PFGI-1 class ICE element type IV pilus protein PilL2 n=1 Tax=Klebsiella pneumoniae TaxID=573 RepID=UPI00203A6776|nr:response regulator [Klebsiella pneumoniae]USB67197.1 response regulator [Klebsiella pneumoniae]HBT4924902.1 response regulator [Klebsiella pneumoniae]
MPKYSLCPVAVIAALLLTACTPKPATQPPPAILPSPVPVEVVHSARYTLVSIAPDEALRYPLRQIASHAIPVAKKNQKVLTRGDALHLWLTGTGYGLCLPVTKDARQLFNSPLPDVQHSPGPLRVEDVLKIIAGPAWRMTVDEITRTVCFTVVHNLS